MNDIVKKEHSGILIMLISFLFFNAVKLTIFNYLLMPEKTVEAFLYKLMFALLLNLVFYSLFFKIRSRWLVIIFYFLQSFYIFSNMSYYKYFGGYLHLFQASALFTEGVGPIKHFTIPVNFTMLIILLDLPFLISLVKHYRRISVPNRIYKPFIRIFRYCPLIILLCIEGLNFYNGCSLIQLNENFFASENKIIERYGTFTNNISDFTANYGGQNLIKHFKYGKTVTAAATTTEKPNIVAIQVESLDAGAISQKYQNDYIAPYLHALSQESIYYKYTLSYHKAGGTSDSEFSIINSLEPLSTYPSIKIPKYDYPNSFVKLLTEQDYYAMAFHGNIGNYYNRDVAFLKMGFDEFNDIKKMGFAESGWGAPDNEVFNYAFNEMEKQKSPFFTYVISMSSHMPFNLVSNYYNNSAYDNIEDEIVKNYYNSISYVDKSIEEFVKKTQAEFPNTYILIWGDHTPGITSDDYKQASFTADSDYFEFVPLLVITPDNKTGVESGKVASFLDIAPTILNAAGIGFTLKTDGINLLNPPAETPEIPFKDKLYNRDELYNEIDGIVNTTTSGG